MAELFEKKPNPLFYANLLAKERIVVNQGGTFSGKSYSIMQVLVTLACSEVGRIIVVAGGTIPKLKDDVMKIMAEIVGENPNVKRFVKGFNIQDRRYEFSTRSTIEFKSYEDAEDAKGGKFDYLYISEATRFEYATCEILMRNTKFRIFLDYNPTARFWVHDILLTKKIQYPSVKMVRSWHEHNLYLSEEKHREIESIEDPDMWKVYARGLTGKLAGLVFRWSSVEQFPVEGVQELIWGLDFGYTQDPTALTKVAVMKGGGYVVQELTYQAGIAMEDIYEIARRNGYYHDQPVYCDHDKELIVQLRRLSMLALPAEKGEILNGILYCKQQDIRYTANSRNMANELMRYKFIEINGVATNKPIDAWNHCFVGDTLITTDKGDIPIRDIEVGDMVLTSKGYRKVLIKWDNGVKQVHNYSMQLGTQNVSLCCTENHKIKTDKEWKEVNQLSKGMKLYLVKSSTDTNTIFTKAKDILVGGVQDCIAKFGSFTTAKFLMDIMFIMLTITLTITISAILILLQVLCIFVLVLNKLLKIIPNGVKNFTLKVLKRLKNGINPKKVGRGIVNTANFLGLTNLISLISAKNVAKNLNQGQSSVQVTAITTARLKHIERSASWKERVYDITVDGEHEYFANGILVHNCLDSVRYAIFSHRNRKKLNQQ